MIVTPAGFLSLLSIALRPWSFYILPVCAGTFFANHCINLSLPAENLPFRPVSTHSRTVFRPWPLFHKTIVFAEAFRRRGLGSELQHVALTVRFHSLSTLLSCCPQTYFNPQ
ncbi:hypothetical protein B0H19DRAFT_424192 [Mycena capillaripes]|nr:hypothetical protein B0H19DRAFT_424192 [Mycena capillaripes]